MRYNVNRLGEQYQDVTAQWLASITNASEFRRISAMDVGETLEFARAVSGPIGKTAHLVVTRTK